MRKFSARRDDERKEKATAFAGLCGSVKTIARRLIDGGDLTEKRMAALEDRLALLDGGDDAKAATRAALSDANTDRVSAGRDMLAMKINPTTGKAAWSK